MAYVVRGGVVEFTCGWGPGFVYLLRRTNCSAGRARYKIGMSTNPAQRAKALNMTLLHMIPVENMRRAEKSAHWMFGHRRERARGEMFFLSPKDVALFKAMDWGHLDSYFARCWDKGRGGFNSKEYLREERQMTEAIPKTIERLGECEDTLDIWHVLKVMGQDVKGYLGTTDDYNRVKVAFHAAYDRVNNTATFSGAPR